MSETMDIGGKIKDLRQRAGLTQEELADRCELTKGYISQLENDLTSPSIVTLNDILLALGTDMGSFFNTGIAEKVVFGADDYVEKETDGATVKWLIPNSQKNEMEPIMVTLLPGARTEPDNPHEGEEFGYIITGRLKLIIGKTEHPLKKGDSFYYSADKTHYLVNDGGTEARLIFISSPPNF